MRNQLLKNGRYALVRQRHAMQPSGLRARTKSSDFSVRCVAIRDYPSFPRRRESSTPPANGAPVAALPCGFRRGGIEQRFSWRSTHTGFPPSRICANLKWCKHAFAARHAFWAVPPSGGVQQPNCSLLRSGQARALTRGTAAPALKPSHATGKAHVGGPGAVVSLHQFACPTLAKSNPQGETRSA